MDDDETLRLSDDECPALFRQLFPNGLGGADVFAELAPDGWEKSPLLAAFHPSPEQVWEESVALHKNIESLTRTMRRKPDAKPLPPPKPAPTLDEIKAQWSDKPVEPEEEMTEVLARALWDIFSNNHSVIAADGREVDIGSFRGAAGFLAEFAGGGRSYMDFYMGTIWIARRCDFTPVYEFIFRRLRAHGLDWIFKFSELGVVRFQKPEPPDDPASYDPSAAFAAGEETKTKEAEFAALQSDLHALNESARAEARRRDPPETVVAYRSLFFREIELPLTALTKLNS